MLGCTGLENLTICLCFDADGTYGGLDSIREDLIEMGYNEALAVWYALTEIERDRLKAEAWEDACLSEQDERTVA